MSVSRAVSPGERPFVRYRDAAGIAATTGYAPLLLGGAIAAHAVVGIVAAGADSSEDRERLASRSA